MGKLLCEKNLRDLWCRNESVRAEIGQILHTRTRARTHARAHARTHAHTRTHTHTHTHTHITVTVFKTSRHSKLLFFVKDKGQWNAKSGPKVGGGKVAICEKKLRDVWCRNESVRAEIGTLA